MEAAIIIIALAAGAILGHCLANKSLFDRGFFNGYQEGYSDAVNESIQDSNKVLKTK